MYSSLTYLNILFWFLSALLDFSLFCRLWQMQEYRRDRFRNFLGTEQGRRFLHGYLMLWRPLALLVLFILSLSNAFNASQLVFLVLAWEMLRYAYLFRQGRLKLPDKTAKAVLIIGLSISVEGLLLLLIGRWPFIFLLMILRFLIISLAVRSFYLPTQLAKKYFIRQATEKLEGYANLTVIGITGSYGKTTVKYFLTQILEKKFKVIKTPQNINTDI
ncbi:MAG: Mur ligase family protein, partial [bacterium]